MSGVNFALVLILILQSDLNAKRIAGLYFGIGEGCVYATGVASGINHYFKISLPNRQTRQFSSETKIQPSVCLVPSNEKKIPNESMMSFRFYRW